MGLAQSQSPFVAAIQRSGEVPVPILFGTLFDHPPRALGKMLGGRRERTAILGRRQAKLAVCFNRRRVGRSVMRLATHWQKAAGLDAVRFFVRPRRGP